DYLQLRNTLLLVREHFGRYKASIRWILGVLQLGRGLVQPSSRGPYYVARARVWALVDHARGRYGPPPRRFLDRAEPVADQSTRPPSAAAISGRMRRRYQPDTASPTTRARDAKRIAAIQATWERPARAHAHAGRRAASSSAHTVIASGMDTTRVRAIARA